jgi:hypothetical protein
MLSLPRLRNLRDLVALTQDEQLDWAPPTDNALARGVKRAEELASNSRDPVVDAAALFFAFSEDDSAAMDHLIPLTFAFEQLEALSCAMTEQDALQLVDFRDMIAEGFPWDEFASWFAAHVIRYQ